MLSVASLRRASEHLSLELSSIDAQSVRSNKPQFVVPDRTGLPALGRHARLQLNDGRELTMGFAETTRGCKHVCRHCPVVPVYGGKFRAIPQDVVMQDIRQQVAAGAQHISFGDPDFLNGPHPRTPHRTRDKGRVSKTYL